MAEHSESLVSVVCVHIRGVSAIHGLNWRSSTVRM